jgi:glutathione synthase/RimK-type ligase-like ATP-grasp enzyme
MEKKKVLILTHLEDSHASSVRDYLNQRGIENFTVITEDLLKDYKIKFSSENLIYTVKTSDKIITLDSSWNIWNRRIMIPDNNKGMPKDLQDLVTGECEKTWDGLLMAHKGKVVNLPQNHFYANNKLDQIKFALENGAYVPDTIVTNDPSDLRDFYEKHKGNICFKLQKGAVINTPKGNRVVYTNKVTKEEMKNADLVSGHPSLFQQYIDKGFEIRIISTDRTNTGIAIHSQDSKKSQVDYRHYDFKKVKYNFIELPKEVKTFCSKMLSHYGLHFGAFDFIYSKEGEYVFLELNPNGQWLWLEEQSKYNLTKEVADNLIE